MISKVKPILVICTVYLFTQRSRVERRTIVELSKTYTVYYICLQTLSYAKNTIFPDKTSYTALKDGDRQSDSIRHLTFYSPIPFGRIPLIRAWNEFIFIRWFLIRMWLLKLTSGTRPIVLWFFHVRFYRFITEHHGDNLVLDTIDHMRDTSDLYGEFMKRYKTTGVLYNHGMPPNKKLRVVPWGSSYRVRLEHTRSILVHDVITALDR